MTTEVEKAESGEDLYRERDARTVQAVRITKDANLAKQGLCECRVCHRNVPLPDAVVVSCGANILFAVCRTGDCFPRTPLILKRAQTARGEAIYVGPANREVLSCPSNIVVATDMSQADAVVAAQSLPTFKNKMEL